MLAVAILAAGKGTRMVSKLPKVLHKISGESLLERIIKTLSGFNSKQVSNTLERIDLPFSLCKTFGKVLCILVPLPAANIATASIKLFCLYKFNC